MRLGRRASQRNHSSRPEAGQHPGDESGSKLLDFGLAKLGGAGRGRCDHDRGADRGGSRDRYSGLHVTGTGPGTDVGCAVGYFFFGLVLYEMLSGRRAFSRETTIATMSAIVKDEPLARRAGSAGTDHQAVSRETAPARFQTMTEVKTALEKAEEGRSQPATLHRRAAVRQHEPRCGRRVLQRRTGRGDH